MVPKLLEKAGASAVLRAIRRPGRHVEIVQFDGLNKDELLGAMKDVSIAYYLMHGMQGGKIQRKETPRSHRARRFWGILIDGDFR